MQLHKTVADNESLSTVRQFPHPSRVLKANQCVSCGERENCFAKQVMKSTTSAYTACDNRLPLQAGKHLFRAGDDAEAVYIIRSGSLRMYLITEDGEEQVLGFYFPGDVLGLDSVGVDSHITSAIVMETSSICKLPLSWFHHQDSAWKCINLMSEQLAHDYNLMLMLAGKDANGRMACFLLNLSKRFKQHGYSAHAFNLSMRRTDIASYLGLALETVSRTLRRFQDSGLLEITRRTVEIHDLNGLRQIAGKQI